MISRMIGLGLLATLLAALAACSEDSNDNPTPSLTGGAGGTGGSAGTGGGSGTGGTSGSAGSDGSVGTGGTAGVDAGGRGGSAGTSIYDGGPDGEACRQQPSGCWPCPEGTDQFHNRCTTSTCAKFDNAAKIRDWNGGNLRPLPGS
jgi:hypothetical protein